MEILTSFVGPHGAEAAMKVRGAFNRCVLPLTLKSDLGLSTATFGSQAKLNGWCSVLDRKVRDALHHPNKLRYAGCERPEQLAANPRLAVMVDDAGWLTRHLPLDINACEPFAAWQGSLRSYLASVRLIFDALGIAIRRAVPMSGVRLLASEVFDVTPLTATSMQPPHTELRTRYLSFFGEHGAGPASVLGPQWNPISSHYNTAPVGTPQHVDADRMESWMLCCRGPRSSGAWACLTPLRDDGVPIDADVFSRDLRIAQEVFAFGDGLVIWANPRTPESANAAVELCSAVLTRTPDTGGPTAPAPAPAEKTTPLH